jgi:hypothetical protein
MFFNFHILFDQSQIWLNLPVDDCHFWLHHKMDQKLNIFPMWKHPFVVCSNDQGRVHFLFWNGFVGSTL